MKKALAWSAVLKYCIFLGLMFMAAITQAEETFGDAGLGKMAERVAAELGEFVNLLIMIAYVCGVGFALAGVIQFKTHKESPTQVPLSKPIIYLAVGACLLFLPSILKVAGETILGSEKEVGVGKEFGDGSPFTSTS